MIVTQTRTVDYAESDPAYRIKLGVLLRRLQEAAMSHSESVGFGSRDMAGAGSAWILNRLAIDIRRRPVYREPLTVATWHRGARGFMAYRDFRLTVNGVAVALATSRWLLFDFARKRVVKIPKETTDAYGIEDQRAMAMDIDAWSPPAPAANATHRTITTRAGDYDPNGHVNNAVYFDYLETLLAAGAGGGKDPRRILIEYQKEISRQAASVSVGLGPDSSPRAFQVWTDAGTHAAGELAIGD